MRCWSTPQMYITGLDVKGTFKWTASGGSEWGLVFSVICPQFLVFAVNLANILVFTVFGENTV